MSDGEVYKGVPLEIIFTSFRDSKRFDGLKVSIDRTPPRFCCYPVLTMLVMPITRNLNQDDVNKVCQITLDSSWDLVREWLDDIYQLGIRTVALCCWCTKEQIIRGKACEAVVIGKYIESHKDGADGLGFPVKITYQDGRELLEY